MCSSRSDSAAIRAEKSSAAAFFVLGVCFALSSAECYGVSFTGVSLAGADFGETTLPGTYNSNYTYPTTAEVNYFIGKGMNTFRIPFRWERLQRTANGAFDATELGR